MTTQESIQNLIRLRAMCRSTAVHWDDRIAFKLACESFVDEHAEQIYEMLHLIDPGEPCSGP